ncbi:hypothetical protein B0H16DRAFT_1473171 [Mycena metata]|uniref:Uncharacterized protein n=1 Tax=Mycena metata TaxID=1033252 RepID=A0AAD7HLR2_9AGAR|nr:hypothetical protein B0H16DRAFT_1473171 [Mycena metata]
MPMAMSGTPRSLLLMVGIPALYNVYIWAQLSEQHIFLMWNERDTASEVIGAVELPESEENILLNARVRNFAETRFYTFTLPTEGQTGQISPRGNNLAVLFNVDGRCRPPAIALPTRWTRTSACQEDIMLKGMWLAQEVPTQEFLDTRSRRSETVEKVNYWMFIKFKLQLHVVGTCGRWKH